MAKEKKPGLIAEFKAFISRGNVLDMAVGVIIGGAFNAIVTSVVNILLSLATWAVPGGLKGLVTVLPALNAAQQGVVGQKFDATELTSKVVEFANNAGATDVTGANSANFVQWQNTLLGKYTLHGTTYTYNLSAVIDWGAFINAVISFLIIALTLFVVVKVAASFSKARLAMEAKAKAAMAAKEEAPAEEAAE